MENTKIIFPTVHQVIQKAKEYAPGYNVKTALSRYCNYLSVLKSKTGISNVDFQKLRWEYKIADELAARIEENDSLPGRN